MIYRPEKPWEASREIFTHKRWLKLPYKVFLNWIKTSVDIREPTPLPMCLQEQLKPGYHWPELIH